MQAIFDLGCLLVEQIVTKLAQSEFHELVDRQLSFTSPVLFGCVDMASILALTARQRQPPSWRRGVRTLTSAATAAQQILHAFEGTTRTCRQVLDGHQLQKLSLTLNRKHLSPGLDISAGPPPLGTPVPPGYHLVYFSPAAVEAELGADGTDKTFNAPDPFSRRMWAGGEMIWNKDTPLRVGEEAEERTKLVGATAKKSRAGTEMVLVDVEKEFWGPRGCALIDRRSWIFRPPPAEALARAQENVAGVVARPVGTCSTIRDVHVEGSGELSACRTLVSSADCA